MFDEAGPGVADISFTVPIVRTFGHAAGIVFGDENGNGRFGTGEGLGGAQLTLTNQLHTSSTLITIDESNENDDLLVRAVRPLTNLSVNLEFTKEIYQPAERPTVRVTLKNSGNRPLTGIVANCNRSGEGPGLDGRGPAGATSPATGSGWPASGSCSSPSTGARSWPRPRRTARVTSS